MGDLKDMLKPIVLSILLLVVFISPSRAADDDSGFAAFQRADYEEAYRLWLPLAEQGDPTAQFNIGVMHDYGLGVERVRSVAVKWYVAAAENGSAAGQVMVGDLFVEGYWGNPDEAEAAEWYRFAAEQGHPEAQRKLGVAYGYGQGVPQDRSQALAWLEAAVRNDDTEAQYWLNRLAVEDPASVSELAFAPGSPSLSPDAQTMYDDPGSPVGGNPTGDVTIVEFFDYRCPHCQRAAPRMKSLLEKDHYVRVVYKELPILGPASVFAARAALAARSQGEAMYFRFHDALMASGGGLGAEQVFRIAAQVGLDPDRLQNDIQDPGIDAALRRNRSLAASLDITGTPAYVIGDQVVSGAVSLNVLRTAVEEARAADRAANR
jgi:protein-disulfide isomerase